VTVLNAFLSTWSNARRTFGEGSPQTGAQYDSSGALRHLESNLESAAPGSHWTGSAATAYGIANTEHRRVIGQLAGLDQRLSAHVDQSAEVVAAGRRDLDAVRSWVVGAAANVPQNATGERMMLPIVQKGIGQVIDIVKRSNGDLNSVGEKLRALRDEYQLLGNQKFAPKQDPWFGPDKDDEDEKDKSKSRQEVLDDILRRYQVSEDPDGMVEWEPPWPFNQFTDPQDITATEARMLDDLGILGQRDMQQIKDLARETANSRFPPPNGNEVDNHNDAFRHAYWNALMTQRFGEEWTHQFATAHERRTDNYASSEAMDLYNNEVGRKIAAANPNASPEQLADMVEAAVRNGDTVVIRPDGQGLEWSNNIPVGGPTGDSSVSAPVPGNNPAPVPIPSPGGGYDPQQPGGYGTTTSGY
jgi:hypothetical protein